MSFQDMLKKAEKAGRLQLITSSIKKWDKVGDKVVGRVKAITDFDFNKFDTKCKKYLIETDKGNVSLVLGSATDVQLSEKDILDKVIVIEYLGKEDIGANQKVNRFDIKVIPDA